MALKMAKTPLTEAVQFATWRSRAYGKQPGRRFGPPMPGVPAVETPGMGTKRREDNYRRQTGRTAIGVVADYLAMCTPRSYAELSGLTPRQRRRSWKKRDVALKRGPLSQVDIELGSKGKEVVPA